MISSDDGIIITGASRGIGARIALYLAEKRTNPLLLIARSSEGLENISSLCREKGAEVHILQTDLLTISKTGDSSGHHSNYMPAEFKPAVLINNAGGYTEKNIFEATLTDYSDLFRSNVLTAVSATDFFLPHILKNKPGLIVNICSIASLEGLARSPAYSVAKHGLLGYTRSLRKALTGENVGVTAINLGPTDSESWNTDGYQAEKLIDPVDIARIVDNLMNLSGSAIVEEILVVPA